MQFWNFELSYGVFNHQVEFELSIGFPSAIPVVINFLSKSQPWSLNSYISSNLIRKSQSNLCIVKEFGLSPTSYNRYPITGLRTSLW